LALLVDLDSHPPDFLAGAGADADWAEVAGLSVPETEAGAEVEATLEAELISWTQDGGVRRRLRASAALS
jgi:hypothetical protein